MQSPANFHAFEFGTGSEPIMYHLHAATLKIETQKNRKRQAIDPDRIMLAEDHHLLSGRTSDSAPRLAIFESRGLQETGDMTEGHERVLDWCGGGDGSAVSGLRLDIYRKEEQLEDNVRGLTIKIRVSGYILQYLQS